MVRVKIITPFFADQTNTHYTQDAEVSVPKDLAERHGENGTGFIEVLPEEAKQQAEKAKAKK